ncbi:O-succinylhomoserine sulfhydrylase [Hyphomicrobium methylovorum]|uniref:O-succinylhomoserine sulfhydrylase n=1 Tax=Hyphomicrobium methylovorum TaxID=84 RepID=UPI0015E76436|nr:O-succinylhomoserine sulfhydrylase [Hyphomicrobium methylovorum]MBA2126464.1 O-succinylhomoserine sulfhydrylase [Hyphomicrobium methylovorum]
MANNQNSEPKSSWRPETALVHAGTNRSQWSETSEALYLTQGFVYNSAEQAEARFKQEDPGYQYTRFGNPTISMFEDRLRIFEGAEDCRATATGMAAVTAAILSFVKAGDHIVAARAMFGSCRNVIETICARFGVTSTLIDGKDLNAWKSAIQPNTKLFFFETPSNPNLELVDIQGVCKIARDNGIVSIVDNVFATPLLQRPLALGADLVVYSATKHIDGQGRCLGGAVLGSKELIEKYVQEWIRQTGPSLAPFNAWVLVKSLETMPVRIRAQCATAAKIADLLTTLPNVTRVLYPGRADHPQAALAAKQMPGGGQMIAFEVDGGKPAAFRVLNALRLILLSNNLGDAKSIVTHPATTTHFKLTTAQREELGISDGMIRLSIGLEAFEDLADDLSTALEAAKG